LKRICCFGELESISYCGMLIFCRPSDRTVHDIAVIVSHLRHLAALTGVPPLLLNQLASVAYLEHLDSGVTCKANHYIAYQPSIEFLKQRRDREFLSIANQKIFLYSLVLKWNLYVT
jgi:hypothetical protein